MTTGDFANTKPDTSTTYTATLGELRDRDNAVAEMFRDTPTNPKQYFVRWVRASRQFEEYDGSAWQTAPMVIAIVGGGTGGITASAARSNLGLGTIATQASNSVAITGGTITGISTFTVSGTATLGAVSSAGTGAFNALSGDGSLITAINASNISTGTIGAARLPGVAKFNEGRLSLTSGTSVTTSDVTGAATVYFTLHTGNQLSAYSGSAWVTDSFSEMSIALSGGAASLPNDIFYDYNGGTAQLTILAWTNSTTRATNLTVQNGRLVKSGDTQQLYLGTLELDGSKQCADSFAKRHCWNYYNREWRPLRVLEATNSWSYTTDTWREANGSTSNRLRFIIGVSEDPVSANVVASIENSTSGVEATVGIGLDSITARHADGLSTRIQATADSRSIIASWDGYPGIGSHYLSWLERSTATGTATWFGDSGGANVQSGILGRVKG